ncbi:MAG: trehalose-phosphatase [Bifidobacterium subtile]|nr:trehalose-phosphatase [Bifidobacterium subtile]MCI1258435.1 trehalose-phosphatase [Bifidobacterium subtile]
MPRLIIVSNRLPMSLDAQDDGSYSLKQNVGGLATAIGPYHRSHHDCLWVGWSGEDPAEHTEEEIEAMRSTYEENRCVPLFLSAEQVSGFYAGFSNNTLWPLLHDFSHEAVFDPNTWETYSQVNQLFADALAPLIHKGDTVWVQDYHLMLLPNMLRQRFSDISIGWFLHVPFPSPEIFRSLPQSRDILRGVLGADLLGFHTVDFVENFKSCVQQLLDIEVDEAGRVAVDESHTATIDAFPIGIDYNLYRRTTSSSLARAMRRGIEEQSGKRPGRRYNTSLSAESSAAEEAARKSGSWWSHHVHEELPELTLAQSALFGKDSKPNKVVVSVDRLDYTKGLPERLRAFERLLEKYPEWTGHVTYYLLATPSRGDVETYRRLKQQVDQLVGKINGRFSMLAWTPIHYITRSLPIKPVCGIYAAGDVALVTPLRDGMNLVAKEYLACHDGREGALVLSDMCGAAKELTEAFIVNPYDIEMTCEALHDALEISPEESTRRNRAMQARIKARTAGTWCAGFLDALLQVSDPGLDDKRLRMDQRNALLEQWAKADRKLLLCDYDGTLTPLVRDPNHARPTLELRALLSRIGTEPGVDLAIVSGRSHAIMDQWFGELPVSLVAEHGAWRNDYNPKGRTWVRSENMPDPEDWQPKIEAMMQESVNRVPRSFIEHKADALAWHYRASSQRSAQREHDRLIRDLRETCGGMGLMVMENSKIIEVCPLTTSKGHAVSPWVSSGDYDFVLAVGDDATDETMFAAMPEAAWTLKVGTGMTKARSRIASATALHRLFGYLIAESEAGKAERGK